MEFKYAPMFQLGEDTTEYYKIPGSEKYVSWSYLTVFSPENLQ